MINQELLDYIKRQLDQGVDQEQIETTLKDHGWKQEYIGNAFALIFSDSAVPQPPEQNHIAHLPKARSLFKQAWSLYKSKFLTLLSIALVGTFGSILVSFVTLTTSSYGLFSVFPESITKTLGLGFLFMLLIFVTLFISMWSYTAMIYALIHHEKDVGFTDAFRNTKRKVLPFIWVTLLLGFIVGGGFGLFIIPGIIFVIWFSLAHFVFIAENEKGMSALLKSREYVSSYWRAILWRMIFISAASLILSYALRLVLWLLKVPSGSEISLLIVELFFIPLNTAYWVLIYRHLKALKGDLAFSPTRSQKAVYIIASFAGIALAVAFFSLN